MQDCKVTRTEIVEHIEGVFGFHALAREDIISAATRAGARAEVIEILRTLPNNRPYSHIRDLWSYLEDIPV